MPCPYPHLADALDSPLTGLRLEAAVDEIRYVPTIATHPIAELPLSFRRRENA